MIVRAVDESAIRLEMGTAEFTIETDVALSPYHLLVAALATCGALALESWSAVAQLDISSLSMDISWELAEGTPALVTRIETVLCWPDLPLEREAAARHVVEQCGIHASLACSAEMELRVTRVC